MTICAALAACCFAPRSYAWAESAEWREKLSSSAPAAWQEIEDLAKNLDTVVMDRRYGADGKLGMEMELHSKFSNDKCVQVCLTTKGNNSANEKVLGWNGRYGFDLGRAKMDMPWRVKFVGADFQGGRAERFEYASNPARVQLFLGPSELPKLWGSPSFKVTDVEPVSVEGETYVEVAFENLKPADANDTAWPVRGKFTLAPERLWAMKKYNIEVEYADEARASDEWATVLEFQPSTDGLPLMHRWEHMRTGKGFEGQKWVWDYERYAPANFPDQDFTLSAFGLPEIQTASRWASSRLWLYLLAAGVVCVVIGIALRTRSKHAAAAGQ